MGKLTYFSLPVRQPCRFLRPVHLESGYRLGSPEHSSPDRIYPAPVFKRLSNWLLASC